MATETIHGLKDNEYKDPLVQWKSFLQRKFQFLNINDDVCQTRTSDLRITNNELKDDKRVSAIENKKSIIIMSEGEEDVFGQLNNKEKVYFREDLYSFTVLCHYLPNWEKF